MYNSFRPGEVWLDTKSEPIQAHGGSIITVGDTFYWYGENKEKTTKGSAIWHWGVRCYSSTDLYNWVDEGLIIPPEPNNTDSPLHPSESMMDRPHILFNEKTKKYVCWLKCMKHDGSQSEAVLTADSILGPYTMIYDKLKPLGMNGGDFDLVKASDGKAYYYFERVHSELICADLTDDYTNVTGYYSTHFPLIQPPYVREAPAYFTRKGFHYLVTSGTTGYCPNPSMTARAETYHGPWAMLGNTHPSDTSRTSFNSQISSIFKHPAKKELYIALADRWLPHFPELVGESFYTGEVYNRIEAIFQSMHDPDAKPSDVPQQMPDAQINGDANSRYVWLPLNFDNEYPIVKWLDEWRIEDYI